MKKITWLPYGIALCLLGIATWYDYAITDTIYGRLPIISSFFERIILVPVISVVVITFVMLFIIRDSRWYLLLGYIASWYVIQDTMQYWMKLHTLRHIGLILLIALLYLGMIVWILKRFPQATLEKRLPFFIFFTCVLVCSAACTTVLKQLWGRIRYRDLQDIKDFIPWYLPQGFTGHHSFPSGHTAGFTTILCLLEWKEDRAQTPSSWRYLFIWGMVLWMPLSRMMMGAHFLSDTIIGFLITYSWYLFFKHSFQRRGYL